MPIGIPVNPKSTDFTNSQLPTSNFQLPTPQSGPAAQGTGPKAASFPKRMRRERRRLGWGLALGKRGAAWIRGPISTELQCRRPEEEATTLG